MHDQNAERWRELCEQAAVEQDPLKLVSEINRMLLEKEERLQQRQQQQVRKQRAA